MVFLPEGDWRKRVENGPRVKMVKKKELKIGLFVKKNIEAYC